MAVDSSHPDEVPDDTVVGTWLDGRAVQLDAREWSVRVAEFLGFGFRVSVPAGAGEQALLHARSQADDLAALLDARIDDVAWDASRSLVGRGLPVVLEGGWESVFRGPPGPPLTRIRLGRTPAPLRRLGAVELPWRVATGSPLSSLPVISTHEQRVAERWLADGHPAGAVGLWCTPQGALVGSTAGSLLACSADGRWMHPAPGPGVVEQWLTSRVAAALGSRPATLPSHPAGRMVAIDVWGSITVLQSASATGDDQSRAPDWCSGLEDAVARALTHP